MAAKRRVPADNGPFGAEHFRWPRCREGHRWERRLYLEPGRPDHTARVGRVLVRKGMNDERTAPLKRPLLFRDLAACPTTPAGIRSFADTHGFLGVWVHLADRPDGGFDNPLGDMGERESEWVYHIARLRAAVGIIDALTDGRTADLSRWVMTDGEAWNDKLRGQPGQPNHTAHSWFIAGRDDRGYWTEFIGLRDRIPAEAPGIDRVSAARRLAEVLTNSYLEQHCFPYLQPRPQRSDISSLKMQPKNLLGACWWQVARLLTGDTSYRPCKVCGRQIELSRDGEGFRADREFCTAACKARDYRGKVRRAKELRAAGKTVRQIARELGTKVEKAEGWLTKKK